MSPAAQISSRKVMQQVLLQNGVPAEAFSPVCVVVDKLDKIGEEKASVGCPTLHPVQLTLGTA